MNHDEFKTADLCDHYAESVRICAPGLLSFGGHKRFAGPITTIKCFEDNSLVREALSQPGAGGVLVVDAGGSRRCAMLGDQLAKLAIENAWSGVVMNGLIRDSADIASMPIGVKALGVHPLKSQKRGVGERDLRVRFAEVDFDPGDYLYADEDGILCSAVALV